MRIIQVFFNQSKSFQKLLFSGGVTFLYRIAGLFLNFFITFFITKTYGESVFGNYSLIFTLLQASTMIFALGLPNALINYLGLHKIDDHFSQFLLKKGLKIILLVAVIPCFFYFFLAKFIAISVFKNALLIPYINIVASTLPFFIVHEYLLNFFIATKKFKKYNVFMFVLPNLIFLCLLFWFSKTILNESYLILFYSISVVVTVCVALIFAFKKHEKTTINKLTKKQIVVFASPMMLSSLMLFLLNWTAIFMLGIFSTAKDVGVFNLAYKLSSLAMLVIISMNVVLAPKISELFKSNKLIELHQTIKKATRLIVVLTLPIVLALIVFSEPILSVFGHNFIEGKTALIIITIGVQLNVMTGNVDQILNMTGNQKTLQRITVFGFFINVVLNCFLIPNYGINGAAVASLITNLVFNLICLREIKQKLGFYTFY